LVGRDAEVGAIAAALDAAAQGAARAVVLLGDAGVGKSRLAEEGTALARARGFLTLHAAASPLHADLHYGVVVEALRPVVRTVEAGARTRLVEGLPDLGRLFGDVDLPPTTPLGDPNMERIRLFEAVCRLLDRLTGRQPVLLFVDDIHWADPTSLAVLHYVVRGLVERRFLLLVTRRASESSRELDALWSSLRRTERLTELTVGSLDAAGVTALARGLLADDPPSTLIDLLVARTRGLPLFVRALVTTFVDSGRLFRSGGRWMLGPEAVDAIAPELIGLLRSRLDGLDAVDRAVFDTVAVAGGAVGHDLLSMLATAGLASGATLAGPGGAEAELLGCVRRLRGAGLLAEDLVEGGVRYQATHPLLAEVAYDELPAVARRRAHAAIVSALTRLGDADPARQAHHIRGAGDEVDPSTALEVLVAALDTALESKAGAEAAGHAEAAIGLARRLGVDELLPRLREQRAEAIELAGHGEAAIAAWRAAAEDSAARGRLVDAARQLRRLALAEWDTGRLGDSQKHIEEATASLASVPIAPVHLAVAETRMRMLARRGKLDELRAEIAELERIAEVTGSRPARAFATWGRADLCLQSGDHRGTERAVRVMMGLAREQGSVLLLEEAHRPAVCNAFSWGDHATAVRLAEEGRRLARETGVPTLEIIEAVCLAFGHYVLGDWDEANGAADEILALSHRVGMRRGAAGALCVRALVHTRRGQLTDAVACLQEARSVYREGFAADRHLLGIGELCEVMVLLTRSDVEAALKVAWSVKSSGLAVAPICLSVLGEVQVAAGDLTGARETASRVAGHGPGAPFGAAVSAWIRGLVARSASEPKRASVELGRATDGFTGMAMPYEAAVSRLNWAEVLAARAAPEGGEQARAAMLASEALDVLDRLGARPAADRARRLLRQLGVRPTTAARGGGPGRLSARETEIARLVAEGLSNPEIAERLFISQRTVTTHLQRIYQRLGISSRTALTRYVVECVPPEPRIT
jgi:DNA-binding CsgD family transcriptional regulator/tetratricopeptide (TPR) repeat protein